MEERIAQIGQDALQATLEREGKGGGMTDAARLADIKRTVTALPFPTGLPDDLTWAVARIEALEAALAWFADGKNYRITDMASTSMCGKVQSEGYHRARRALGGAS